MVNSCHIAIGGITRHTKPMKVATGIYIGLTLALLNTPSAQADTVFIIQNNFGPAQPYQFQFESSDPYNYQKLGQGPEQVAITFTQPVSVEESSIEVIDMYGATVNSEPLTANGKTLYAPLPELMQGPYKVKWKARCRCSERTQINDVFRFTVR